MPFGMFLIFALLSSWKSQYYTWPLFASSFCGKHGVAQGGFVCFSFVSSSFFLWKFSLPSFMNKEDINERKCGFAGGRQTERRGLEGSTFTPHTQVRWRTHLRTRWHKKVRLQNLHKSLFTYLYLDALSNKLQSRN